MEKKATITVVLKDDGDLKVNSQFSANVTEAEAVYLINQFYVSVLRVVPQHGLRIVLLALVHKNIRKFDDVNFWRYHFLYDPYRTIVYLGFLVGGFFLMWKAYGSL